MPSPLSAAVAIAALSFLPALAQGQQTAGKPVASGTANPKFLQHPDGSMGSITWQYNERMGYSYPSVYWNDGKGANYNAGVRNSNGGLKSLTFAGDNHTVQDGKGNFYLEYQHLHYRVTIAGGRFEMFEIAENQVPKVLLHLDGSPADDDGPPAAVSTVTGSLQVLPMAAAQVQGMEQGAHAPDWQLAEKLARLTLAQGGPMTVHHDKGDAPNFWRRDGDEFSAFLFDEATNAVTTLSRTKSDPANSWKIVDSQGQVKGNYPPVK